MPPHFALLIRNGDEGVSQGVGKIVIGVPWVAFIGVGDEGVSGGGICVPSSEVEAAAT